MNILFDESGDFKVGAILADNGTSLQVEAPHGKRSKVKSSHVLLRFAQPSAAELLETAQRLAEDIDIDFLWEAAGEEEFSFLDLAREYWGEQAGPAQQAAVLLRLHAYPMYFYRKSRGHYRPAPEESLRAALASVERKRREQQAIDDMVRSLCRGVLPEGVAGNLTRALFRPDRQGLEYRAVEQACAETGKPPHRLLWDCGAFARPRDYHLGAFVAQHFPSGTGFPVVDLPPPAVEDLPESPVAAFSIDDATTTEIDDAFSVERGAGHLRVGIHIAAPALGIAPGSELDDMAAGRLSTVYMPGGKITMLPDGLVEQYTLKAGAHCPALSLYLNLDPDSLEVLSRESRVEMVRVVANLRHHELPEDILGAPPFPWQEELRLLYELSRRLLAGRGQDESPKSFGPEYVFEVDGDRVRITERVRGAPVDQLVSELMIHVNSQWAGMLADAGLLAIYRGQPPGSKTRMTTVPTPHEALGVPLYMWASSPLRRYVDLVNQRQLVSLLTHQPPAYPGNDTHVLGTLAAFEAAYDAYNTFQRQMERYWGLVWLQQEDFDSVEAVVVRENLVRVACAPVWLRLNDMPLLAPGSTVRVALGQPDLLDLEVMGRYLETVRTGVDG